MHVSRRARYTGIVLITAIAALTGLSLGNRDPKPTSPAPSLTAEATPAPSPSNGTPGPVSGPTVMYSILGQGRMTLYERRLDGRSEPRELAWREADEENEGAVIFLVGPTRESILLVRSENGKRVVEPIDVNAPDGAPAWSLRTPAAYFREGFWSTGGRYWAAYVSNNADFALVIDTNVGTSWKLPLARGEYPQGFDGHGPGLVVRDTPRSVLDGQVAFRVIDPLSGVSRSVGVSDVDAPPRSGYSEDVAPRAGLWVAEDHERQQLVVADLRTGERRHLDYPGQGYGWVSFTPGADEVLAVVRAGEDACGGRRSVIRGVGLQGGNRVLWEGSTSPLEFTLAPEGDFVGFSAWKEYVGSSMFIIDTVSAHSVELPMPEGSYLGDVLAIRGGVRLPDPALPHAPVEAPPTQSPPAELLLGAPQMVTGTIDYDRVDCTATIRVRSVAPAVDGGLAVVDELPPVVLENVEGIGASVTVAPRPGTDQVLVAYGDGDVGEALLWTPQAQPTREPGYSTAIEPLQLPADWPEDPGALIWRPDGHALGLQYSKGSKAFVWFELDDRVVRRSRTATEWSNVVAWAADGSSIVVRRYGCIDFCDAQHTWLAAVRLADGRMTDVTPETTSDLRAFETASLSVRTGLEVLDLTPHMRIAVGGIGIGDPGLFSLSWPSRLRSIRGVSDAWSLDGRRLYVSADTDEGRLLFRIHNPGAGEPMRPRVVGVLPDRADVQDVEIAGSWVRIRTGLLGSCTEGLHDLATGRSYLADCTYSEAWLRRS